MKYISPELAHLFSKKADIGQLKRVRSLAAFADHNERARKRLVDYVAHVVATR